MRPSRKPKAKTPVEDEGSLEALDRTQSPGKAQVILSSSSSSQDAIKKGEKVDDEEIREQREREAIIKVKMEKVDDSVTGHNVDKGEPDDVER